MITAIKILVTLGVLLVLAYPFIPLPGKLKRLSVASSLKYRSPHNRKNIFFAILAVLEFIVLALVFGAFDFLASTLSSIPFVGSLFSNAIASLNSQIDYVLFTLKLVLVNLIALYAFVILKAFLKKAVLDPIFKLGKKHNTDDGKDDETPADDEAQKKKKRRVPGFLHSDGKKGDKNGKKDDDKSDRDSKKDTDKDSDKDSDKNSDKNSDTDGDGNEETLYGPVQSWFLRLFFEGNQFEFAKKWVIRVRMVLQCFIVLIEVLYLLFIGTVMISMFFPLPMKVYDILVNLLRIGDWYLYPVLSVLFLQEICNVFNTDPQEEKDRDEKKNGKDGEDPDLDSRLLKLLSELKKRFDKEHSLRYYPEAPRTKVREYKPTNATYASALRYIRKQMDLTAGRTVESYMECLDAVFNDEHVYFAASFYSELGEYLVAYTYIRLLAGARMIYVVQDPAERETLRTFISERLMRLTGSVPSQTWRVYTSDERLDQADVLIACPEDFRDGSIVSRYPAFFEEASNAIFIDADRMISLDSYLCPLMSSRLQKATEERIRFIFLTLDLYQGFAASSLPKFFSVEPVLSFSSAKENEAVSYILWNKESKSHRIYNRYGQKLTGLECIIADLACQHGIDGVRVLTESPLDHAERKILASHNVEINKLYRDVADVNYMIYSDNRCNLSASIYACTRFRGKKKSVVHIISKPYLLREYYISKAATDDFINRSSFIQPRVTEHVERHKLSLMRIFCDLSAEGGVTVREFEKRVRAVITFTVERGDIISSVYCKRLLAAKRVQDMKLGELAAYLIAGICDSDVYYDEAAEERCYRDSIGHRAKDYYLIIDPATQDGYTMASEKMIVFNRMKEIFARLLSCNDRVELRLNDETIGHLDTFPSRVHLEYIVGQSITYNNAEYEIEHISEDGRVVCLRHENVKLRNCLDTVHLRRYGIASMEPLEHPGVLHNTKLMLEEIRVTKCRARFTGETYGFYGLTSDKQTIDFYHEHGVDGNPHVAAPHVRRITDGRVLRVELLSRMECTDGMRLLLAAVFNEFARTIFPQAYHGVAFCPVLAEPLPFDETVEPKDEIEHIRALYPYLKHPEGDLVETNANRVTLIVVNDSNEDVGVFDWLSDPSGRYMQEFLANVYSYLHWLKLRPEMEHYIYFGGSALPECYDLEGCCNLLEGYNLVLSDLGEHDIHTAGDDVADENPLRCAFCHRQMESGRYSLFDQARYICADCFDVVDDAETLEKLLVEMREYLKTNYPDVTIGTARAALDPVYSLSAEQVFSEFYYRLDITARTIFTERDDPIDNVRVSLLRGLIGLWQADNELILEYSKAQLYYEELLYLRGRGLDESADWIYANLPDELRLQIDEISEYTGKDVSKGTPASDGENDDDDDRDKDGKDDDKDDKDDKDGKDDDKDGDDDKDTDDDDEDPQPHGTSFDFLREQKGGSGRDDDDDDDDDDKKDDHFFGDDDFGGLYDPNKTPRFWKRYLRNQKLDTGKGEKPVDDDDDDDTDDDDGEESGGTLLIFDRVNAPDGDGDDDTDDTDDTDDDKDTDGDGDGDDDKDTDGDDDDTDGDDQDNGKKKKTKWWDRFRKKKNKKDSGTDDDDKDSDDTDDDGDGTDGDGDDGDGTDGDGKSKKKKDKKEKKPKKPKDGKKRAARTPGDKIVPHEEDEDTNPKIRVYNDIVRCAYNYSTGPINGTGITREEFSRLVLYAVCDYPELFWVTRSIAWDNAGNYYLVFRCTNPDGSLDVKQVNRKRTELKRGAKAFTKGISKRTDPYEAALKIYRRLILKVDYDSIGLDMKADKDMQQDDHLRSLHSALVEHKVVCAGYAVAMQYLLQSVGVVCGYVISETNAKGTCHAFNILKIGKYCYYLDATWGDASNTKTGDQNKDLIRYNYFCVPYKEFIGFEKEPELMHVPSKSYYPDLEEFSYDRHEFYRYHKAYLNSYNEAEIIRIIMEAAENFDPDEMGDFTFGIRFATQKAAESAKEVLRSNTHTLVRYALDRTTKKNAKELLTACERNTCYFYLSPNGVVTVRFELSAEDRKAKKSKDSKKSKRSE